MPKRLLSLRKRSSTGHWFALLAPSGGFYRYVLDGLKRGFQEHGYACVLGNGTVPRERLADWATRYRPTAVLEINRPLGQDEPWPRDCLHLAWIRDYRFEGVDLTKHRGTRSDHIYFLMYPEQFGRERLAGSSWSILLPGTRPRRPGPPPVAYLSDFALCGFIPAPVGADALISHMPDGRPVMLGEFLRHYPRDALGLWRLSLSYVRSAVERTCRRIGCDEIEADAIHQLFDHILPRVHDRSVVVEQVLSVSRSLRLYGPRSWLQWPDYAPLWRGFAEDPTQLDEVFRTTRVNLHNSIMALHTRVIDYFGAGGFIMVHPTPYDFQQGGIRQYFEPDRHYGIYEMSNVRGAAGRYLKDEALRERIALEGQRAALSAHTWPHRAAQILRDLGLPPRARLKGAEGLLSRICEAAEVLSGYFNGALPAATRS